MLACLACLACLLAHTYTGCASLCFCVIFYLGSCSLFRRGFRSRSRSRGLPSLLRRYRHCHLRGRRQRFYLRDIYMRNTPHERICIFLGKRISVCITCGVWVYIVSTWRRESTTRCWRAKGLEGTRGGGWGRTAGCLEPLMRRAR